MTRFDKTAITFSVIVGITIAVILFGVRLMPVTVECLSADNCRQISPYGSLSFTFSKPIKAEALQQLFTISPQVDGIWTMDDSTHATWRSTSPIPSGTPVIFGFAAGVVGEDGESFHDDIQWNSIVRSPAILYLKMFDDGKELYRIELAEPANESQFSDSDRQIYDFAVSADGEQVAYSAINADGGVDLWIQARDGNKAKKILDCSYDHCTTPAWSPDRKTILFTREKVLTKGGNLGAPRVWMITLATGNARQFFDDDQMIGYGAAYSPDGSWIHYWDGVSGGIQLFQVADGSGYLISTQSGNTGSWSADSRYLYFTDIRTGIYGYRSILYRSEVETRNVELVLGGNTDDSGASYEHPMISPDGSYLVLSVQRNVQIPGREIEIYTNEPAPFMNLADDLSMIFSQYSWSSDSTSILYSGDYLTDLRDGAQIWIFDLQTGDRQPILDDGAVFPEWLP